MADKDDLPFLPTRHGTPMGERNEREQRAQVGPESIRRVQRDNLDGSTTVLHTRGGAFEYVTTKTVVEEETEERFDWAYALHPVKKDGEAYVEDVWTNYGPHKPIVDYQYGAKWRRKGLVTRTDGAYSWKLMEAAYDGEVDKKKVISGYHHWISSKFIVTWTDYTRFKFNDFIDLNGVAKVIRVYDRRSKTWRKPIVLEYVKNNADPSTTKIVSACCVSTDYGVRVRAVKQASSYGYLTVSDYTLDGVHVGSRDFTYSSYSHSGYTMESATLNMHSFSQDGTRFLATCAFRVGTGYLVNSGVVEFLSPPPTKTGETFPVTVAAVHTFDEWAIGGSGGGGAVYANPITRCHTPGFSKDGKVCYLKTITGMVTTEAGTVELVYCPAIYAGELTNWNSECTESTELIENGVSIYSHTYTWHKTDTNTVLSQWTDAANATIDCPEPQMYRVERRIRWEDRSATLQMNVSYYKMSLVVLHPANRNEGEFTSEWVQVRDYGHWGGGIVSTDDSMADVYTEDSDITIYARYGNNVPLSFVSKNRIHAEGLNVVQDYPVWSDPEADTWHRWSGWNPIKKSCLYMILDYTLGETPYNRTGVLYKGGVWYDVVTDERDPLYGVAGVWASIDVAFISPFG